MKGMLILIVALLGAGGLASESSYELFHEANQTFDRGEYEAAVGKYQSLIAQGFESGDIHFNLANSFFKSGKLGQAVFHYRRALELSPRDADIRFNLNYAREKVTDRVESRESLFQRLGGLSESVSEKESLYWLTALVLALTVCALLFLFQGREWQRLVRNGLGGLAALFLLVTVHHSWLRSAYGVVTVPEAKVYSGVGKDNVVLFAIHEGVELVIVETMDKDWARIRLADGKQGWARSEDLLYEPRS